MKRKRTKKQNQRLYYIIWRLKNKYCFEINKRAKTVNVNACEFQEENFNKTVKKYFKELTEYGYGIQSTIK